DRDLDDLAPLALLVVELDVQRAGAALGEGREIAGGDREAVLLFRAQARLDRPGLRLLAVLVREGHLHPVRQDLGERPDELVVAALLLLLLLLPGRQGKAQISQLDTDAEGDAVFGEQQRRPRLHRTQSE